MKGYIQGIGLISPQDFFNKSADWNVVPRQNVPRLNCIEPEYELWLDPKVLRRMSRVLKMGSASALCALKEAGIESPDAIITGTAYGCLEDTGVFLSKMISTDEGVLNPTPFIQSTHNSIGAQVALLLKCHGYNLTISQRAFSFEHSLLDALLVLEENGESNVLVGAVDEITDYSFSILKRFGFALRNKAIGEGAAYFVLSKEITSNSYCCLRAIKTIYKPKDQSEINRHLLDFLKENNLAMNDVNCVLSGDAETSLFDNVDSISMISYKNLCGEFPTSTSFAFTVGAYLLKNQSLPRGLNAETGNEHRRIDRVLIYNSYFGTHYTLILLERV